MIGRPLIRLDSTPSTQEAVFRLAVLGAPEGTTVRAAFQSAGRGRSGRSWIAAPGEALLFSILLRPVILVQQLGPLSLLLGDAIAISLQELYRLPVAVKWPNDVLVRGRKVSGVLIQTRSGNEGPVVVVGIGINVNATRDALPNGATSLCEETGVLIDPEPLFRSLLSHIEQRYRDVEAGAIDAYLERVNASLWLRGEQVMIDDAGCARTGTFIGIDADGALLLRSGQKTVRILSGELVRGPQALS